MTRICVFFNVYALLSIKLIIHLSTKREFLTVVTVCLHLYVSLFNRGWPFIQKAEDLKRKKDWCYRLIYKKKCFLSLVWPWFINPNLTIAIQYLSLPFVRISIKKSVETPVNSISNVFTVLYQSCTLSSVAVSVEQ